MVRVVPDVPGLARQFDYTVPERWRARVAVGTRVRIRLHGRAVGAWVSALDVAPPEGVALQAVRSVTGHGPPAGLVELARWAAWRWAGPVVAFLRTASPDRRVATLPGPPPALTPAVLPPPALPPAAVPPAAVPPAAPVTPAVAAAGGTVLLRLAPTTDVLPWVLEAVARARPGDGRTGGPAGAVLVLVPSVGWAGRLAERLTRRGVPVASGWDQAAAGWPVVVGTRMAAWAPAPRLAAAVVLDAHDEAYQEERAPTWSAWEVVVERAARDGAACTLISPCPTVEQATRFPPEAPDRGAERSGWPVVVTVDRRGADPRTGLLSDELVGLARRVMAEGAGPLVCVLNRTGRARLLACAACGDLARCTACGRPVELVGEPGGAGEELHCRGCGATRPVVCAGCGATRFKVLRAGVTRVRQELRALLGVEVDQMAGGDPDPGPGAGDPGTAPVVIGTEAALHRVRRAGGVAFLDFDQHLLAPRFAAADQALALLARAGRLVGGRGVPGAGPVLVQTRMPDHPVLVAATRGDPAGLTGGEAAVRRELDLPPASALAVVSGPGAPDYAGRLASPELAVSDLGDGRWLVRAPDHRVLCDRLGAVARPAERVRVAVDPTDV